MELYHEIRPDAYVIIPTGSINGNNAAELDIILHKAIKSGKTRILVNCQQLSYISSAGIGIFLSHLPRLRETGIVLVFENLNPQIRHVIDVLGIKDLVGLTD